MASREDWLLHTVARRAALSWPDVSVRPDPPTVRLASGIDSGHTRTMNLLAHLYLADVSASSAAGQILGDVVKGWLDTRYPADIRDGIALHRAIDSFSDAHAAHVAMRRSFPPPWRRYAGILVDIGFDYSLARHWHTYSNIPLAEFGRIAQQRVQREWPQAAPLGAGRMNGLAGTLHGYASGAGIQRALDSVGRRLRRRNPVADAWPQLLERRHAFDARLPELLNDLEKMVKAERPGAPPS